MAQKCRVIWGCTVSAHATSAKKDDKTQEQMLTVVLEVCVSRQNDTGFNRQCHQHDLDGPVNQVDVGVGQLSSNGSQGSSNATSDQERASIGNDIKTAIIY